MGIFCSNLKIEKGKLGSMGKWDSIVLRNGMDISAGNTRSVGNAFLQQGDVLLESCSAYRSFYDMYRNEIGLPCRSDDDYDEDFEDFLDGLDDDCVRLIVLNSEIILFCDSFNGCVTGIDTLENAETEIRKLYEESKNDKA